MKSPLYIGVTVACLVMLTACKTVDKPYQGHGPIKVTLEASAAPDEPIFIQSALVKTCNNTGCDTPNSDNKYRHLKSTYINIPVVFPRKAFQRADANTQAIIAFSIYHPNYGQLTKEVTLAPTEKSEISTLTIEVEYFEERLKRLEKDADTKNTKMLKFGFNQKDPEFLSRKAEYLKARYQLGAAVTEHIRMLREVYLPQFTPEDQTKITTKYNPIIKKWFYRYPETNCDLEAHCEQEAQKPRTRHFNAL